MYVSGIVWKPAMVFIQSITAEIFIHDCWLLSSRTHQTSLCIYQGTHEFGIRLRSYKFQPVCYWQLKNYRNHPEIKGISTNIHKTN